MTLTSEGITRVFIIFLLIADSSSRKSSIHSGFSPCYKHLIKANEFLSEQNDLDYYIPFLHNSYVLFDRSSNLIFIVSSAQDKSLSRFSYFVCKNQKFICLCRPSANLTYGRPALKIK